MMMIIDDDDDHHHHHHGASPKLIISGRPLVTNLTCPTANSLFLEWTQPDHFYHRSIWFISVSII